MLRLPFSIIVIFQREEVTKEELEIKVFGAVWRVQKLLEEMD